MQSSRTVENITIQELFNWRRPRGPMKQPDDKPSDPQNANPVFGEKPHGYGKKLLIPCGFLCKRCVFQPITSF